MTPTAAPPPRHLIQERERGSTSIEVVVLFPAVLLLVFGLVQGALWAHARNVAAAAAQEGVRAARAETGTLDAGRIEAAGFVDRAGGQDVLLGAQVEVTGTATEVEVAVTGAAVSLLPGLAGPPVRQSAAGPVERFTTAGAP